MERIARGQYAAGIPELERAYEILPHPNVLFNIGRAYAEQGEIEHAITAYGHYLESGPADARDVEETVAQLRARLERQRVAAAVPAADEQPAPSPSDAEAPHPDAPIEAPLPPSPTSTASPLTLEAPAPAHAEPPVATPAGRDDDVFRETVVTASRAAQSPLDAPSSTSVITEQDIRLSGMTKIPEILRRLAGVEVNTMTGGDTEVSIRGFNSRVSNKILVLIDYRSVYIDLLGATFWEALPIDVEQIERIEVVRGPGSALYGANAFAGIINIITKKPGEGRSGARVGGGSYGAVFGSATATGRSGDSAYRLSAGYAREPSLSREVTGTRRDVARFHRGEATDASNAHFDLQTSRRLGHDVELTTGGGYARVFRAMQGAGVFHEYAIDGYTADVESTLSFPAGSVRAFYTRNDLDVGRAHAYVGDALYQSHVGSDTLDVQPELVKRFRTGRAEHDVHVGGNYRLKQVSWSYLDQNRSENWVGLFAQEALTIGRFSAVVSVRGDYVPYLKTVIPSPRGSLIYKPTPQSAVRLTGATAFRSPSLLESYLDLGIAAPSASGVEVRSATGRPDDPGFQLRRERVGSVDLGYLNQESEFINIEVTGYYLRASDLVQLGGTRVETPSSASLFGLDRATGRYAIALTGWENSCATYNVVGGEAGARLFPTEGLDVFANYSLNVQRIDRPSGCAAPDDQKTSRHKLNAGMQARSRFGLDGEITFHYASPQRWAEQDAAPDGSPELVYRVYDLPAYTLVNARIGYRFLANAAELSATAYDLFDTRHRQYPLGQVVGRRFMGFFGYRF